MSNWEDFERLGEHFAQLVKSDSYIARISMFAPRSVVEAQIEMERRKFRDSLLEVRPPATRVKIERFARKIRMTGESQALGLAGEWERLLVDLRGQISARLEHFVWGGEANEPGAPPPGIPFKTWQNFTKEARKSPWLRD